MKALEIGVDYGYSSVRIARLLPKGSKLISFESDLSNIRIAIKVVELAGLKEKVEFWHGRLEMGIERIKKYWGTVDFVLINHGIRVEPKMSD
jgi:catechol O-methyltransferase